jgi:predicted SAM-dependent methyltransferase
LTAIIKQGTNLTLDIGAGGKPKGDINTDVRPLPGIQVVCDATQLPFNREAFNHVFLSHVIEHFQYKDVMTLLKEVYRVSKIGGKTEIWTPNFQSLGFLKAWLLGGVEYKHVPLLYAPLNGLQDYKENVHISQWTCKLLKIYVTQQGFKISHLKGELDYKGRFFLLRFFTKIFQTRGGDVHLIAIKEREASSYEHPVIKKVKGPRIV